MQFSLRPDGLLERLALWLNLGPVPVAQSFFGMMGARAAMAGVRLGVFKALAASPLPLVSLSERLAIPAAGLEPLLWSLEALRLVHMRAETWELAPRARPWLDPASDRYVGDFLEFNYTQWQWWSQLEDALRQGHGLDIHGFEPGDERWRQYVLAMFQLARLGAPEVARRIALPRAPKSLLDLGGAHGWFSAELCRRHPTLRAQVIDLAGSVTVGRELIARAGLSGRVQHVEGDALTHPLGEGHDGVLCFQLLHHYPEPTARELVFRAARALRPGGTLAILELLRERGRAGHDASALLALHYFLTSAAAAYPRATLERWVGDAGLEVVRVTRLRRLPLMSLLVARRP